MSHLDLLTTDLRPDPEFCHSCDNPATKNVRLYVGDLDSLAGRFCDACAARVREKLAKDLAPKPAPKDGDQTFLDIGGFRFVLVVNHAVPASTFEVRQDGRIVLVVEGVGSGAKPVITYKETP